MSWGSKARIPKPWPVTLYLYPDEEEQSRGSYLDTKHNKPPKGGQHYTGNSGKRKHRKYRSGSNTNSNNRNYGELDPYQQQQHYQQQYHQQQFRNTPYNGYTSADVNDLYTLNRPVVSISFPRVSGLVARAKARDPYARKKARWQQKIKLPTIKESSESIRSRNSFSSRASSINGSRGSLKSSSAKSLNRDRKYGVDNLATDFELPEAGMPNEVLQGQFSSDPRLNDFSDPVFTRSVMDDEDDEDDDESDDLESGKSFEDPCCCFCCTNWQKLWVFIGLLLVFAAAVAGIAIYLAVRGSDPSSPMTTPTPELTDYLLHLRLLGQNYSDNLNNPSSSDYLKISKDICSVSDNIMQRSNFDLSYRKCGIKDFQQGSIIALVSLSFDTDLLEKEKKDLTKSVQESLELKFSHELTTGVQANIRSFTEEYIPDKTQIAVKPDTSSVPPVFFFTTNAPHITIPTTVDSKNTTSILTTLRAINTTTLSANNYTTPIVTTTVTKTIMASNSTLTSSNTNMTTQSFTVTTQITTMTSPSSSAEASFTTIMSTNSSVVAQNSTAIAPNATVIEPNSTAMAPNSTVMAPNSTAMAPNSTAMAPNSTTMAPNSTAMVPNATVMAPNSTIMAPNSTVMAPNSTVMAPNSTIMAPNSTMISPNMTLMVTESTVTANQTIPPNTTLMISDSTTAPTLTPNSTVAPITELNNTSTYMDGVTTNSAHSNNITTDTSGSLANSTKDGVNSTKNNIVQDTGSTISPVNNNGSSNGVTESLSTESSDITSSTDNPTT